MGMFDRFRAAVDLDGELGQYVTEAPAEALPHSAHRPITASGQQLDFTKESTRERHRVRIYSEWQTDAWAYYDAIGEIKYGFNALANLISRVTIHPGLNLDRDSVPISLQNWKRRSADQTSKERETDSNRDMVPHTDLSEEVLEYAQELIDDLFDGQGGMSGLLRSFTVNMSVPGECYFVKIDDTWQVKSSSELKVHGDQLVLTDRRNMVNAGSVSTGGTYGTRNLPQDTPVFRLWREHAQYSDEPDSSMLALREPCDELITLQRMIRSIARSNMNAGILFVPEDLVVAGSSVAEDMEQQEELDDELVTAIHSNLVAPVTDETNASTVVPTILTGPSDAGKSIQHIQMNRQSDQWLTERADRALDRILQGIDMPKDFVTGLANVRFSNAKSIDESMYKSNVEPLVLLFVDSLRTAYLIPAIKEKFPKLDKKALRQLVVWYDPSQIITKADPADSADKGFDKFALSGDAWRQAHGYADTDAPTSDEVALRLLHKATLPPEIVNTLFNVAFPQITEGQRDKAIEEMSVQFPDTASMMLYGKDAPIMRDQAGTNLDPTGGGPDEFAPGDDDEGVEDDGGDNGTDTAGLLAGGGLYRTPYDGNDVQAEYRAAAEALVRAGDYVVRKMPTSSLIPTQPRERTTDAVGGAGAKDLPPIVLKRGNKHFLLDGHHRAMGKRMLDVVVVDPTKRTTDLGS